MERCVLCWKKSCAVAAFNASALSHAATLTNWKRESGVSAR
jgi:hypothetical protein